MNLNDQELAIGAEGTIEYLESHRNIHFYE